jgi:hypothetical protein
MRIQIQQRLATRVTLEAVPVAHAQTRGVLREGGGRPMGVPGAAPATVTAGAGPGRAATAPPKLGLLIDSKNLFIGQYNKLFEEYWLSPISYLSPYRG